MRRTHWIGRVAAAVALSVVCAAAAQAAPDHIALADGSGVPESLTVAADGSVIVGSASKGILLRAAPGASVAQPWGPPLAGKDPVSVLGVLADDRGRTLWACTFELPAGADFSQRRFALRTFDLGSGAAKAVYPSPGCNDIAIARDGTAYVTDTENNRVLRLRPGATTVEPWVQDPALRRPNGITFIDGRLYVGVSSALYRLDMAPGGAAGAITPLQMERPLKIPDGVRAAGPARALVAEMGSPRIKDGVIGQAALVTIRGDRADVRVLGRGYQSPTGVSPDGQGGALILESKLPYWFDADVQGKDPGQVHIFRLKIPK